MTLTPKTWTDVHYAMAVAITIEAMARFWKDKHIDASTAGFVVGFWATALGNDKFNTPNPNVSAQPAI